MKLSSAKPEIKTQILLKSLGHRHGNCSMSSVLCWIGIRGVKGYAELFPGMLKLSQSCPYCQISPWSVQAPAPSTLLVHGGSDISAVCDPEIPHSKPQDTRFPQKGEGGSAVNLLPVGERLFEVLVTFPVANWGISSRVSDFETFICRIPVSVLEICGVSWPGEKPQLQLVIVCM